LSLRPGIYIRTGAGIRTEARTVGTRQPDSRKCLKGMAGATEVSLGPVTVQDSNQREGSVLTN